MQYRQCQVFVKWLRNIALLSLPLALLAGCTKSPPEMTAQRLLGGAIIVTNTSEEPFTIARIVANKSPENGNCNNYPSRTLAPGESYTVTFVLCGVIKEISVETDHGNSAFGWK